MSLSLIDSYKLEQQIYEAISDAVAKVKSEHSEVKQRDFDDALDEALNNFRQDGD